MESLRRLSETSMFMLSQDGCPRGDKMWEARLGRGCGYSWSGDEPSSEPRDISLSF